MGTVNEMEERARAVEEMQTAETEASKGQKNDRSAAAVDWLRADHPTIGKCVIWGGGL